ncbi:hypothetical protein DMENIID0001_035470 [Sergentomyia squamirostris]
MENTAKSHKEWRILAKKMRRKKVRQKNAQERDREEEEDEAIKLSDPTYLTWMAEQNALELFLEEEQELQRQETHRKWVEADEKSQKAFRELQEKLKLVEADQQKEKIRLQEEYRADQERKEKLREEQKRIASEKRRKHEELLRKIKSYVQGEQDLPEELLETLDSNPGKDLCPFFSKTAVCRFGNTCNRNHTMPMISQIVLIPNFFTHILLDEYRGSEHGNDMSLEFEEREIESDFKEFYYDVIPEFEFLGEILNFFVCKNAEPHLRGNVYVEYKRRRDAMKVYQKLQGRYYGGKQLNIAFCAISSWSTAICGLELLKRCPKGRMCCFLHIFRNPDAKYSYSWRRDRTLRQTSNDDKKKIQNVSSSWNDEDDHERRHWRWSESPEVEESRKSSKRPRRRSNSKSRSESESRDRKHRK